MRYLIIVIFLFSLATGCSNRGDYSTAPSTSDNPTIGSPENQSTNRFALAIGTIQINTETLEASFLPDRKAMAHYDVTPWLTPPNCDDCITIDVLEFKPAEKYVKLKVAIDNPTQFTVYDVRGIVISNVDGFCLLNADSYTDLWDDGGDIIINPFKAFATDWPEREFLPDTGHARIYEIECPTLSELIDAILIIDASWPSNCEEPYEIAHAHTTDVFLDYEANNIFCQVLSWNNNVESVTIDLTCLGWGEGVPMANIFGDWWGIIETTWHAGGYGPGTYSALISAKTAGSDLKLFNYVDITIDASPPSTGWVITWGGDDIGGPTGSDVALDDYGNIYVTGAYRYTVDFDPGAGVDEHLSNGSNDAYISKFNSDGVYQGVRTWGGWHDDDGGQIAIDDSGCIYVTGSYRKTVDFDPGPDSCEFTSNGLEGLADIFLSKFEPDGDFLWARVWGGSKADYPIGVTVDENGNVFVTGTFWDTVDFDPGPGVDEHKAKWERDIFLSKFNSEGDFQWANTWGGSGEDYSGGVCVGPEGFVYVCGLFRFKVDFDPSDGVDEREPVAGESGQFLSKFSSDGDYQDVFIWGGYYGGSPRSCTRDDFGNIYLAGYFNGTSDFDPGPDEYSLTSTGSSDIYLSKLNSTGELQWVQAWGGDSSDIASNVIISPDGDIYVLSSFRRTIDVLPGPDIDEFVSNGVADILLNKFTPGGDFLWARMWGGEDYDWASGIASDTSGNVYITGTIIAPLDFDPGPGLAMRTPEDGSDAYITKLGPDGNW